MEALLVRVEAGVDVFAALSLGSDLVKVLMALEHEHVHDLGIAKPSMANEELGQNRRY